MTVSVKRHYLTNTIEESVRADFLKTKPLEIKRRRAKPNSSTNTLRIVCFKLNIELFSDIKLLRYLEVFYSDAEYFRFVTRFYRTNEYSLAFTSVFYEKMPFRAISIKINQADLDFFSSFENRSAALRDIAFNFNSQYFDGLRKFFPEKPEERIKVIAFKIDMGIFDAIKQVIANKEYATFSEFIRHAMYYTLLKKDDSPIFKDTTKEPNRRNCCLKLPSTFIFNLDLYVGDNKLQFKDRTAFIYHCACYYLKHGFGIEIGESF